MQKFKYYVTKFKIDKEQQKDIYLSVTTKVMMSHQMMINHLIQWCADHQENSQLYAIVSESDDGRCFYKILSDAEHNLKVK
jgi:hypothetical protein